MAYTASLVVTSDFGNKAVKVFNVTADAASGSVSTGLNVVEWCSISFQSCATAGFKVKNNLSAASAAANGTVMISSAANGDVFTLIAYGH